MKKQKIVFLDAATVDFGDLSIDEMRALGSLKAFDHTAPAQIKARLADAEIVITNKCILGRSLFEVLKNLKAVCVTATGVNNIDLVAAREKKIAVMNVPGYSTESMVQGTFSFLLALACNLEKYNRAVHDGTWSRAESFLCAGYPIREINGKTLGIIGYGHIGKRVAQIAKAFGMKVLVARIPGRKYHDKISRVSFDAMLRESDFVTIHAPLTDLTRNLISEQVMRKMKRSAFLINMARGGIVDEKALRKALESGRLAGAASDVLTVEPPPLNHVLLGAPNFLATPHAVWASLEARRRLVHEVALNIKSFQKGRPRNRVA